MAYIRNIKQSFFTSEDVVALSMAARLLYIGLWHEADREGRFRWKPVAFRLRYLPTDPVDIGAVCGELLSRRLVVRYGDGLAYIPSFLTHQRPNAREAKSELPTPTGENTRQHACDHPSARVKTPVSTGENSVSEGKEREGKDREGEGKGSVVADAPSPLPPPTPPKTEPTATEAFVPRDAWLSLAECWNTAVRSMPIWSPVETGTLPKASQSVLLKALRECPDITAWEARFTRAAKSLWLTGREPGRDGSVFVADLWWLIDNIAKLDAGRYDTREKVTPRSREQAEQDAIWERLEAQAKAVSQ